MSKEYNVPSIDYYSDSLGNKIYSNQLFRTANILVIIKSKLNNYKLYPGDTLQGEVAVDESFDTNSYSIHWIIRGQAIMETTKMLGKKFIIKIEEKHINESFGIRCFIQSNKEWHRFGKYDDMLQVTYQVLPLP